MVLGSDCHVSTPLLSPVLKLVAVTERKVFSEWIIPKKKFDSL